MQVAIYQPLSPNEEQQIEDSLTRSRIQMLMSFPFFGILALHLQMERDYTVPTAATDGDKFYYNPHFIKSLNEGERNWIVVHEVMHPALKHLWRRGDRQHKKWNYACDYAIHDIMMQFIDTSGHNMKDKLKMPKGVLYDAKFHDKSAEEIYDLLPDDLGQGQGKGGQGNSGSGDSDGDGDGQTPLDDHSKWDQQETQQGGQQKATEWEGKMVSAAKSAESKNAGNVPGFLKRLLGKLTKPQKDWRTLLHEFIQEETNDYSFNPPDRRYSDSEFFLPDFNDVDEIVKDLVFYVDTSGSIGDKELNACYSEIVGAIHQFNGKLCGKLGFFDHIAYGLTPFEDVQSVLEIRPQGGGGTSFHAPFEYVNQHCEPEDVAGIIILTDGYASFPDEKIANGKPVLWVMTTDVEPTFGLHTRIKI